MGEALRDVKIEKIDDNKIKVVLSYDDILLMNLDIMEINPGSKDAEKLFSDILNMASSEIGFNLSDSKVMIEAIPSYKEGYVMFVTKLSKRKKQSELYKIIYSFSCMEILKCAYQIIKEKYDGEFKIYLLDGLFYLVLFGIQGGDIEYIKVILVDYGKRIKMPEIFMGVLEEYGEKLSDYSILNSI